MHPVPDRLVSVQPRLVLTAAICVFLTAILDAQQIIFSHRVYAAQGRSYQQLWIWSADTGTLTQISHAERDHSVPTCEEDGRHILFDAEENALKTTRWRLDRTTGAEEPLRAPAITVNLAREAALVRPDGVRCGHRSRVAGRTS